MPAERRVRVAIVGGGFSGTMAAAQLARRGISSGLIECAGRAGQGAAYSTKEPAHLLNIRASLMGAWADNPEHFAVTDGLDRNSFAERRHYGRYLRAILDEAIGTGCTQVIEDRAIGAERGSDGWRVRLQGGPIVEADALVLAIGNQAPAQLSSAEAASDRLIDDPWEERARSAIADAAATGADVLILGSSLTMVDTVLSLDEAGHRGRMLAVSRRGKLPLPGGLHDPAPVEWDDLPPPRVRALARWLRERSAGMDWRSAIDSLRPHSHRLWQAFPLDQKKLFLRSGRPWWDIHRHRIAPQVAARIDELIGNGRLEVVAGRLLGLRPVDGGLEATIRRRGRDEPDRSQRFAYVFNCTGPLHDVARTRDPLLRQLLDDGLAAPDELGIGLSVDERSRANGSERLWALGTLTKGRYWEMIAVPDIREQAAAVADDIATELGK